MNFSYKLLLIFLSVLFILNTATPSFAQFLESEEEEEIDFPGMDIEFPDIDKDPADYTDDEKDAAGELQEILDAAEAAEDLEPFRPRRSTGLDTQLMTEWVPPFMLMTEQFTALMIQQVRIIGTFFDAKHQLETQRLFQTKVAEAHKDYQPSAELCEVGTFIRDLADSQKRTQVTKSVISQAAISRALGSGVAKTYKSSLESDVRTRRNAFISKFCNIQDNAGNYELACGSNKDPAQQNADLNYTQTIDLPLTINANFIDPANTEPSLEEQNLFSFLDQIFLNDAFPSIARKKTALHNFIKPYQEMRSLIAMQSVAHNSFAHIIGEKTVGPEGEKVVTPYIFSLLREMGIKNDDALLAYMGEHPSYYAQMEVLTKKLYQHPEFISNLYDKPTNVKRVRTALNAIKLMQDRDINQAMLRREMLTSMILELQVRKGQQKLQTKADKILNTPPGKSDFVYGSGAANSLGVGTFNENSGGNGF